MLRDLSPSSPLRVLVVEDNPVNRRLLEAFLADAGHVPVLAASGGEALATLEQQAFDVALVDVQMPGMNGFELTAAIRAREGLAGARLPIAAITAHDSPQDRQRCLAAGMDGYLAKPARYAELIELVESLASREPGPRPAAGAQDEGPSLRKELSRFVADSMRLHAEMDEAILRRDGAALQRAAHSLTGTAGFFKADAVFALARRLEELGRAAGFGADADRAARELGEELARLASEGRDS